MAGVQTAFSLREATMEDHEAIINIRNDIYDGFDYVPALLNDMLKQHRGFVATAETKVVRVWIYRIKTLSFITCVLGQ